MKGIASYQRTWCDGSSVEQGSWVGNKKERILFSEWIRRNKHLGFVHFLIPRLRRCQERGSIRLQLCKPAYLTNKRRGLFGKTATAKNADIFCKREGQDTMVDSL